MPPLNRSHGRPALQTLLGIACFIEFQAVGQRLRFLNLPGLCLCFTRKFPFLFCDIIMLTTDLWVLRQEDDGPRGQKLYIYMYVYIWSSFITEYAASGYH